MSRDLFPSPEAGAETAAPAGASLSGSPGAGEGARRALPGTATGLWDPEQYGRFADERSRPFFELVSRVRCARPRRVVDLGCGPGRLTAALAQRWPEADILGIDGSDEMIKAARESAATPDGRVRFEVGDVTRWPPGEPVDVVISNAVLHWVPGHRELLPRWLEGLMPGGWLAFQVPGNFGAPSHVLLRELCGSPRWRGRLDGIVPDRPVDDCVGYLELLAAHGCRVDAWETTYAQVLQGDDPVLEWTKGTALRPVLAALGRGAEASAFLAEYAELLRAAYPSGPSGTVFPFRRIFVVARTRGGDDPAFSGPPRSAPEAAT